jgi:hypothetical protein
MCKKCNEFKEISLDYWYISIQGWPLYNACRQCHNQRTRIDKQLARDKAKAERGASYSTTALPDPITTTQVLPHSSTIRADKNISVGPFIKNTPIPLAVGLATQAPEESPKNIPENEITSQESKPKKSLFGIFKSFLKRISESE